MAESSIIFTDYCNLGCGYCFAKGKVRQNVSQKSKRRFLNELNLENIKIIMKYLKEDNQSEFQLIGGEPTLHSKLEETVDFILNEGFSIRFFTNGTFDEEKLDFFKKTGGDKISYTVNINSPEKYPKEYWRNINSNLEALKEKNLVLAYNIYNIDFEYSFIIDLAKKYGIRKFSVSVAMPAVNKCNICIEPSDYKRIIPRLLKFSEECGKSNIKWGLNCCLPFCIFEKHQLKELLTEVDCPIPNKCNSSLIIGLDLQVWMCLSLSDTYTVKLTDFDSLLDIRIYYERKFAPFRRIGIYEECFKCEYSISGKCQGACYGHIRNSFNKEKISS